MAAAAAAAAATATGPSALAAIAAVVAATAADPATAGPALAGPSLSRNGGALPSEETFSLTRLLTIDRGRAAITLSRSEPSADARCRHWPKLLTISSKDPGLAVSAPSAPSPALRPPMRSWRSMCAGSSTSFIACATAPWKCAPCFIAACASVERSSVAVWLSSSDRKAARSPSSALRIVSCTNCFASGKLAAHPALSVSLCGSSRGWVSWPLDSGASPGPDMDRSVSAVLPPAPISLVSFCSASRALLCADSSFPAADCASVRARSSSSMSRSKLAMMSGPRARGCVICRKLRLPIASMSSEESSSKLVGSPRSTLPITSTRSHDRISVNGLLVAWRL